MVELLDFLDRRASRAKFQVIYGLTREEGGWRLLNYIISFLPKGDQKPEEYVYGNKVALIREIHPYELPHRIRELVETKQVEVKKFSVVSSVTTRNLVDHHRSEWSDAYPGGGQWPYFRIATDLDDRSNPRAWETLLSEKFPVFPKWSEAMNFLTGFHHDSWENIPGVMILLQDFRGRIELVEIDSSTIRVKIESLQLKPSNLLVKVYAESEKGVEHSEPLTPDETGHCKFKASGSLVQVTIGLLEKGSDMPIDTAEWSPSAPSRKFKVRGGTGLESLITQGESETVEYKVDIHLDDYEEFMETISSFANTGGGVIILGVNDHLEVEGFERKEEDIARIIDDGMDNVPRYRIDEQNYRGKRLLLIHVEKGKSPPYASRRTHNSYGRRRGNDYVLSSSEVRNLVLSSSEKSSAVFDSMSD